MLDVIGAGATAASKQDWYEIWTRSKEAMWVQQEIEEIHTEGRNRPAVEATMRTEFATSMGYQTIELTRRNMLSHWRDATYLVAKLVLNIASGVFIGFTFYKAKDSIQGSQNKLFVSA
jgi:ATP-binding cassette subfamily G (WHITE) protein 2 (SNQ2)